MILLWYFFARFFTMSIVLSVGNPSLLHIPARWANSLPPMTKIHSSTIGARLSTDTSINSSSLHAITHPTILFVSLFFSVAPSLIHLILAEEDYSVSIKSENYFQPTCCRKVFDFGTGTDDHRHANARPYGKLPSLVDNKS